MMEAASGIPDLSVVIITWRMREMLRDLLASLYAHTKGISFEVILADNNSRDGTLEMLRAEYPEVRIIENDRNRGVAAARNQCFVLARGRYRVTIDADMVLLENALGRLVAFMDARPEAGLAGCKLVSVDGEVQRSARRTPTAVSFLLRRLSFMEAVRRSRALQYHEMAEWDRGDTRTVDYVIGACQCIRREAMEQVGLLDERIFYGPEDLDYCLRMRRAGWEVWYVADTRIVHYEQRITRKKLFSKLTYLHFKGIFYLFRKYRWKLAPENAPASGRRPEASDPA